MDFVTLAMFIIDDIYFPIPRAPRLGVLGGAGTWSIIGARIFRNRETARRLSWTLHQGSDFPPDVERELRSLATTINWIATPDRLTTRATNWYRDNDIRDFEYQTPKLRIDFADLTPEQLFADTFHMVCAADRCIKLVEGILKEREKLSRKANEECIISPTAHLEKPFFIWEPVPPSCTPEEKVQIMEAMKLVDVMSPNEDELAAIFGELVDANASEALRRRGVFRQCQLLNGCSREKPSAVVVRRGERGCYIATAARHTWLPPYHQSNASLVKDSRGIGSHKVIDPTGGGNAFLGGFCIGLLADRQSDDNTAATIFETAAIYGSVAASFAIEQVGLPILTVNEDGLEFWNGEAVDHRLREFAERATVNFVSTSLQEAESRYGSTDSALLQAWLEGLDRDPVSNSAEHAEEIARSEKRS